MKISYDNQGRLSEIIFAEGENQEACLKTLDHYIDKLAEASKYAMDKNVETAKYNAEAAKYNSEVNLHVMEFNYAVAALKFDNQLKPCNVDKDPNKDIELTT